MTRAAEKKYAEQLTAAERCGRAGKPFPAAADRPLYRAAAVAMREGAEKLANFVRLLAALAPPPGGTLLDLDAAIIANLNERRRAQVCAVATA